MEIEAGFVVRVRSTGAPPLKWLSEVIVDVFKLKFRRRHIEDVKSCMVRMIVWAEQARDSGNRQRFGRWCTLINKCARAARMEVMRQNCNTTALTSYQREIWHLKRMSNTP